MADEKAFSHITVTADDEDDFVIQAGARTAPRSVAPERPEAAAPEAESPAEPPAVVEAAAVAEDPIPDGAEEPDAPAAADDAGARPRPKDEPVETRLEDLAGSPMPKAQKAVLAVALLLIVAAAVYYCFFMR